MFFEWGGAVADRGRVMQAVILAAGLGTRLRPVTDRRSKAMVPVVGTPLVELALAPMVECGIRDVVMVIGPDDDEIRNHFGARTEPGISLMWVTQERRLGMAHALAAAARHITGPFVLSACDSLVGASHVRELLAAARDADTVLSLLDVEPAAVSRSAAVEIDGSIVRRIVEKPRIGEAPSNTVSLPHYVFSPDVLPLLSHLSKSARGEYELQEAIQRQIDSGARVVGVRATDRVQVSTPEDLLELSRRRLREEKGFLTSSKAPSGTATKIIDPVHIEPGARIGRDCTIGPEVFLESGCAIGDGAEILKSIVLRGARVAGHQRVVDTVVAD